MDEQFVTALRAAVMDTIRACDFGSRERLTLVAGEASPQAEQVFVDLVADALERRLIARAQACRLPRPLLN